MLLFVLNTWKLNGIGMMYDKAESLVSMATENSVFLYKF